MGSDYFNKKILLSNLHVSVLNQHQTLTPNIFNPLQDVTEILTNMSSASWADRKEGLIALQNLLRGSRVLNRLELRKVTEIFTRMFHDPHGKVNLEHCPHTILCF